MYENNEIKIIFDSKKAKLHRQQVSAGWTHPHICTPPLIALTAIILSHIVADFTSNELLPLAILVVGMIAVVYFTFAIRNAWITYKAENYTPDILYYIATVENRLKNVSVEPCDKGVVITIVSKIMPFGKMTTKIKFKQVDHYDRAVDKLTLDVNEGVLYTPLESV